MNSNKLKFPLKEIVIDYSDQKRNFTINLYESPIGGHLLIAKEDKIEHDNGGYQFEAYHESNVGLALGDLRRKIKKHLSVRFLEKIAGKNYPRNDELVGLITSGGIVVDGIYIEFEKFSKMLDSYEGFQFKLIIKDRLQEII
ncbi:DUF7686 domain-containing protein [Balneola sp. EhC07]|uniref:DUF7686 domain-containing protein n=1 Tax=Balneola sp. EhC07 TaxID=1849360 RepID=UPI001290806E|nr:hypothetical protein [Balneola sp. EhC07]